MILFGPFRIFLLHNAQTLSDGSFLPRGIIQSVPFYVSDVHRTTLHLIYAGMLPQNRRHIRSDHPFNFGVIPSLKPPYQYIMHLQISPQKFFDDESQAPHTLSELTESLKTLSPRQLDLITDIVIEFQKK